MQAKLLGNSRKVKIRKDWETAKIKIMREALLAKFSQHDDLKLLLLSTGDSVLVENAENDSYWGVGKDAKGRNMLGVLLVEVRDILRQKIDGLRGGVMDWKIKNNVSPRDVSKQPRS